MAESELRPQASSYGAEIRPLPEDRSMKYYPVFEIELETIATFNSLSAMFIGIAAATFMALVGFVWDLIITGPISKSSEDGTGTLIVLAAIMLLVSVGLAVCFQRKKTSTIQRIMGKRSPGDVVIESK